MSGLRFQLVKTTGWYKENGMSSYGLGVQVDHFADHHYGESELDDTLSPGGWQVSIQLGIWALIVTSAAGVISLEGPGHHPWPLFELVSP